MNKRALELREQRKQLIDYVDYVDRMSRPTYGGIGPGTLGVQFLN